MNDNELLLQLQEIMADTFDLDSVDITPETTAADIEEWDSLSHIRLIVAIEREFGIKFSNAEIEDMNNVGDLMGAIRKKTGQPA
ncbi:MAG: acyl carrier protein [Sphingomonas sanxanigenens]|uniref:Acyl carrier protein n=1 Tax=Sphingomonas sanxanigenens TaxID=397260 RepID=A0A2W5CBT8_9SPHN|nr:MAG: acyl carrier protein [Sphingomonas sanxanigenens]